MESNLSCKEKAELTYKAIERRKAEAERGKQAAINHLYENSNKIKKRLRGERKAGSKEW